MLYLFLIPVLQNKKEYLTQKHFNIFQYVYFITQKCSLYWHFCSVYILLSDHKNKMLMHLKLEGDII